MSWPMNLTQKSFSNRRIIAESFTLTSNTGWNVLNRLFLLFVLTMPQRNLSAFYILMTAMGSFKQCYVMLYFMWRRHLISTMDEKWHSLYKCQGKYQRPVGQLYFGYIIQCVLHWDYSPLPPHDKCHPASRAVRFR